MKTQELTARKGNGLPGRSEPAHQRVRGARDARKPALYNERFHTETLDAPRAAIRDKEIALPRRLPIVEEFARHMAADAKVLDEDPDTGAKKYRYIRTGEDHYSMAFTYALMASTRFRFYSCPVVFL